MSIAISLFALFIACYQLYLQRTHNEKSLRPLPQIVLGDFKGQIFVHVKNNGIGPLILDKITFARDGRQSSNIEDCLDMDPKSYMHDAGITGTVSKVIQPGAYLEIFNKQINPVDSEIDSVRQALCPINLRISGRDIYNNKITIERDFQWFARHINPVDLRDTNP